MSETIKLGDRLKHAWNVFNIKEVAPPSNTQGHFAYGIGSTSRPDRPVMRRSNERTIVSSIYNRIAVDVSSVPIHHVRVDQNGSYKETIKSGLNRCLTIESNIDQTPKDFMIDVVLSMFDEGVIAIVPVETQTSLKNANAYDILSMRTGKIRQWYPKHVRVELYDENDGTKKELLLPKSKVAIVENPFYSVMNDHGSVVKRLIDKLNLLDTSDNKAYNPKLDLIVQLPYSIRSEAQKKRASDRLSSVEDQLQNSEHGIAYLDATEKIVQLNRPIDNKLVEQVKDLQTQLYSELGTPEEVFKGTADEKTMLNYQNNTIEPILAAITSEMTRKFLTKTAQTQGQEIKYIQNPFRLVTVNNMAEIADKFTRNEVLAPNEIRSIVGYRPIDDDRANELRNRNLNASDAQLMDPVMTNEEDYDDHGGYEDYEEYDEGEY